MSGSERPPPPPLRGRSDRGAVREGGTPSHHPISALHRRRAKSLRGNMTDAEKRLWSALRANRFQGLSFRRQTPIGPFIVDFVCHERRVIIELDGGQHAMRAEQDREREKWLELKGYRIIRFWNSDVLRNRNAVLEMIARELHVGVFEQPPSRHSRTASAIGDLPLKGGGDGETTQ